MSYLGRVSNSCSVQDTSKILEYAPEVFQFIERQMQNNLEVVQMLSMKRY